MSTFVQELLTQIGKDINQPLETMEIQIKKFQDNWINNKEDLELLEDNDYQKLDIPLNLQIRIQNKLKKRVQINNISASQNIINNIKNTIQNPNQQQQQNNNIPQSNSMDLVKWSYQPKNLTLDDSEAQYFKYNWVIQVHFKHNNQNFKQYSLSNQQNSKPGEFISQNAFTSVFIPLASDEEVKSKLIRFDKKFVRQGILLEILDYMAAYVCFRFLSFDIKNYRIVTACIDHIQFNQQIESDKDLVLNGYPTFVGTSSIEIKVDFVQNGVVKMSALAVFVSLAQKGVEKKPLPKLVIDQNDELKDILEELQKQGQINYNIRKLKKEQYNAIPHNLGDHHQEILSFVNLYDVNNQIQQRVKNYINVSETLQVKTLMMQYQDRNSNMTIFGGYLMREAYEIGIITASQISRGMIPIIKNIEDIQFINPVYIGSVMKFQGKITCVYKNYAYVKVECIRVDYDKDTDKNVYKKTNDLKLITYVGEESKEVIPVSYEEVLDYIKYRNILVQRVESIQYTEKQQEKQ